METKTLIKRIRETSGMTQEQVAEAMGVSVNTVQNWERFNLFKNKDMLHDLLDLYKVDDVLRTRAVLEAFGRSENRDYFITEFFGEDDRQPSRIAVQDIYDQKDISYPFPIDQMISCLNVICTRLSCVQGTILFLEGYIEKCEPVIFCRESAIVIDRTCKEYDVQVCAEQVYEMQMMDEIISVAFPFGDEGERKEYVKSYDREMTYNELFEKESAKISLAERSDPGEIETLLYELELEELALAEMKYRILTCLIQTSLYEGFVEKEYLVDAREESFWTLVHLRVTDQTFKIPSTVKETVIQMRTMLFLRMSFLLEQLSF